MSMSMSMSLVQVFFEGISSYFEQADATPQT
jgi:hypothetical protein